MSKLYRIIKRKTDKLLRNYFAPFLVLDSYGTDILCWSYDEAFKWLKHCSPDAKIVETYDYHILATRNYSK